jgi:hypothetical protein
MLDTNMAKQTAKLVGLYNQTVTAKITNQNEV